MPPEFADSRYPKNYKCLQRVYPLYHVPQRGRGESAEPRGHIDRDEAT